MNLKAWVVVPLCGVLLNACITPPPAPRIVRSDESKPPDTGPFWWGISSGAFQTEDRAELPGSPNYFKTDWDLFAEAKRVPPKGESAEFSWSNFDKDLDALKKIGVSHYRFSIEWARVEPEPGRYNEAALRRYVEMARMLKASGIEPVATLWHFTFPSWLVTKGNASKSRWLHPLYRERWPLYVEKVTKALALTSAFTRRRTSLTATSLSVISARLGRPDCYSTLESWEPPCSRAFGASARLQRSFGGIAEMLSCSA